MKSESTQTSIMQCTRAARANTQFFPLALVLTYHLALVSSGAQLLPSFPSLVSATCRELVLVALKLEVGPSLERS